MIIFYFVCGIIGLYIVARLVSIGLRTFREYPKLKNKTSELENKVSELKNTITVLKNKVSEKKNDVANLNRNLQLKENSLLSNKTEQANFKMKLVSASNKIVELNEQLKKSESKISELQNQEKKHKKHIDLITITTEDEIIQLEQTHKSDLGGFSNKILELETQTKKIQEEIKLLTENSEVEANKNQIQKRSLKKEHQLEIDNLEKKILAINKDLSIRTYERDKFEKGIKEQSELFNSIEFVTNNSIAKITSLYSDFTLLEYDLSANYLFNKKRPARKKSIEVKALKQKSKFHLEQYRKMLYKYEYLLNIFPELSNYVDDFDSIKELDKANSIEDFKEDFDNVQNYLSKKEYLELDEDLRNQLALDRYLKGNKTSWQIGRDYELYCGLMYEEKGWEVEYFGIEKRLNDLGRDLIVKKGNEVEIVQCKLWKKTKTIHEKHILQLYGTTIIDTLINPDLFNIVTPVFITNTKLSETATKFANLLGVRIVKWDLEEFPRIKCNIGVDENGSETKIYHLPFDQHYDRTKIKKDKGFFVNNIKEAADKGFRRSYKYYGK